MDMKKSGTYEIRNTQNGRVYIGSTNNFERRFKEHTRYLEKGTHSNEDLQREYTEYGAEAFEFAVDTICCRQESFDREEELLHLYADSGNYRDLYNVNLSVKSNRRSYESISKIEGTNHYSSTLREVDVVNIREMFDSGDYSNKKLSEMFNLDPSAVSNIVKGRRYKNVGGPIQPKRSRKLNYQKAQEIRELLSSGKFTQAQLAKRYNVTPGAISKIIHGKLYDKCQ